MQVRKLNELGLKKFEEYIENLRMGNNQNYPHYLLDDESSTDSLKIDLWIDESLEFPTRFKMGVYLNDIFSSANLQPLMGDTGFWSWFALAWFKQLCPVKNGLMQPDKLQNYILSKQYNLRPRHAIFMTWQLVNKHGEHSKSLLCKAPSIRGELTEQLMTRQAILSMKGAVKLANRLYYDEKTGIIKRGTGGKGAGSARRYVNWIQQLQVTYDVFSMSSEELFTLLPKEFQKFTEYSL